jgi:hypothetical protein
MKELISTEELYAEALWMSPMLPCSVRAAVRLEPSRAGSLRGSRGDVQLRLTDR